MAGTVHVTEGPAEVLHDVALAYCQAQGFNITPKGDWSTRAKRGSLLVWSYFMTLQAHTNAFDYVNFLVEVSGDESEWRLSISWYDPGWWAGKVARRRIGEYAKHLGDAIGTELRRQNVKVKYVQEL